MSESISQQTFDHLVGLAALELDQEQAAYLLRELNHQLKAIHELEAIPNPGEILSQAPENRDGYIVVPDIPHTTLE